MTTETVASETSRHRSLPVQLFCGERGGGDLGDPAFRVCGPGISGHAGGMIDLIRKTVLAGVGAMVMTREKIEESMSELVEKGRISAKEAREVAEKIAEEGRREFETVSADTQKRIKEMLEQMGVGQKDRIGDLEKRLLALEIEVQNLTHKMKSL